MQPAANNQQQENVRFSARPVSNEIKRDPMKTFSQNLQRWEKKWLIIETRQISSVRPSCQLLLPNRLRGKHKATLHPTNVERMAQCR